MYVIYVYICSRQQDSYFEPLGQTFRCLQGPKDVKGRLIVSIQVAKAYSFGP